MLLGLGPASQQRIGWKPGWEARVAERGTEDQAVSWERYREPTAHVAQVHPEEPHGEGRPAEESRPDSAGVSLPPAASCRLHEIEVHLLPLPVSLFRFLSHSEKLVLYFLLPSPFPISSAPVSFSPTFFVTDVLQDILHQAGIFLLGN